MGRRSRSTGRSRDRDASRAWLGTLALVVVIAAIVVSLNVPAASFTSLSLTRNTSADVVTDPQGILGLNGSAVGSGSTLDLTKLVNQLGQNVSVTITLSGSSGDRADIVVDGVNYGDSVTLSDVGPQEKRNVKVAVYCNASYVGSDVDYTIDVSGESLTGGLSRTQVITQHCIPWYQASDWDGASSETGVVHDGFGDHNATDVELGYDRNDSALVSYWPFDEDSGTTVTDVVGPNDGSLNGASIGQEGILASTGYAFATSEYVTVGDAINNGAFSLSFWFKPDGSSWSGTLYDMSNSNGVFYVTGSDSGITFRFDAGNKQVTLTGGSPAAGEWHHVVVTGQYTGKGPHKLYVDGTLVDSSSQNMNKQKPNLATPRIGNDTGAANTDGGFDGRIDEVRAYDAILTDGEVSTLYHGGTTSGNEVWSGTLTTDWESTATIDVGAINFTDVVSRVPNGTDATLYVETDLDGDGTVDETSDPIDLNGSSGPFPIRGLTTDADRFRLRIELDTTDIAVSSCFSAATLIEDVDLARGSFSGCGKTDVTTNEEPSARFTFSPSAPSVLDNVTFDASNSSDPDGTIEEYRWDFQSDGSVDATTTDPMINHTFDSAGTYDVKLTVVDDGSATNTTTKQVTVSAVNLVWESAVDWDNRVSEGGVVHDGFGDHNASWIELGYAAAGTNLRSYWHFDEDSGTTADDAGPLDLDGSLNGDVTVGVDGIMNTTAFRFDGDGDYVDVGSLEDPLAGTASLSVWIETTQVGNDTHWQAPGIAGVENASATDDVFWGWINASGHIGVMSGDDMGAMSATAINDGELHHVVLTYNASTGETKVFVDGRLEDTATTRTGDIGPTFSSIGRIEDTGGTPEYFNGTIEAVRTYDAVLNATQVKRLRRGATPTDAAWRGRLLAHNKSVETELNATNLKLKGVTAAVPAGTNLTVWVQSDPDGDGTFEEESAPIAIQGGTADYLVPDGSLASNSTTFRIRVEANTSGYRSRPRLDDVEITTAETNDPPTASFTYTCSGTTCSFDASGSSDSDGTIQSYDWAFGDGTTGSGEFVDHTYDAPGTYTVNLTVTDGDGATDSTEKTITVSVRVVWASASDWDNATSESDVVHASYGDRLADRVTLGVGDDDSALVSYWPFDEDSGTTVTDVVGPNDGTLQSGTVGEAGIGISTGYHFAASEYATVGDAINNGAFSLSFWFKPDGSSWSGTLYDMSSSSGDFYVIGSDSGIEFHFDLRNKQVTLTGGSPAAGEWHHVVVTGQYTGKGPHKLYVDGTLVDSSSQNMNKQKPNLATPRIGDETGNAATNGGFDGRIDEVRTHDTILTDGEASTLHSGWWNGSLTTASRTFDAAVDPTNLTLQNVSAAVPAGTNLTVYVQSDPDGDGTFEEESAPIALNGSGGPYDVGGGTLSTDSSTYRLRFVLDTANVTVAPDVGRVELVA